MDSRHLAEYHVWAGEKTREIVGLLSDVEYEKEIDKILGNTKEKSIHIVIALLFCFHRMKIEFEYLAESPRETIGKMYSLSREELMRCWKMADDKLAELILEERSGTVTYTRNDGESFCLQVDDFLLQYLFHTIYHRGQLNYCLKALNKPRIESDYLFYFAEIDKRLEMIE
ncbi:MAG: DinB family protein [Candidatus Hodarchaeales archaeon]|jgi:uncharacterized damage-inducible protein DinB